MPVHAGIDLIDIKRIKKLLGGDASHFLKRICTATELEFLKTQKRKEEKVAALFALKEAFSKALGTGMGKSLVFKDVEVTYTSLGQPRVAYVGTQFQRAGEWDITCSVSHEGGMLAAVVVLQGTLL